MIEVHLHPDEIVDPPVVRTLSCLANADFYTMHLALQTAFGWATTRTSDFAVIDPAYKPPANPLADFMRRTSQADANGGKPLPATHLSTYSAPSIPCPRRASPASTRRTSGSASTPPRSRRPSDKHKLWQMFDNTAYKG